MESCSRLAIYFSIFTVSALGGRLVQCGQMTADALVSFIGFCFRCVCRSLVGWLVGCLGAGREEVDHLSICVCECNALIPRFPPTITHSPIPPYTHSTPPHSLNFAIQGINYSYADLQRGSTLLSHVMGVLDAAPAALEAPAGGYVNPGAIRCVSVGLVWLGGWVGGRKLWLTFRLVWFYTMC